MKHTFFLSFILFFVGLCNADGSVFNGHCNRNVTGMSVSQEPATWQEYEQLHMHTLRRDLQFHEKRFHTLQEETAFLKNRLHTHCSDTDSTKNRLRAIPEHEKNSLLSHAQEKAFLDQIIAQRCEAELCYPSEKRRLCEHWKAEQLFHDKVLHNTLTDADLLQRTIARNKWYIHKIKRSKISIDDIMGPLCAGLAVTIDYSVEKVDTLVRTLRGKASSD